MLEIIAVVAIVVLALFFTGRSLYRTGRGGACGGCPKPGGCGAAERGGGGAGP